MKRPQLWRSFATFVCLALALCIAFLVVPSLTRAQQSQIQIARVITDVHAGEVITKDMFSIVPAGAYNLPDGVLQNPNQIDGKYSLADLKAGDFFLSSKVSDTCPESSPYLNNLGDEQYVISLTVNSLASGVSCKLKAGDVISVISIDPQGKATIPDELRYTEVIAATSSKGIDQNEERVSPEQQSKDDSTVSIATISLIVNERQARRIAEIEAGGKSHLLLVCRGDVERKVLLLDEQEAWLTQNPELPVVLEMAIDEATASRSAVQSTAPNDSISSP